MPLSFFDYTWIFDWVQGPTWRLGALMFVNILWMPLVWWLLKDLWDTWNSWVIGLARDVGLKVIYLAVDVPRDAEQTPKSMEQIFNQLSGAHGSSNWWEDHWGGDWQSWFGFEIVSIEGYVQYVIRCEEALRDLVEASVYAQYPDAEITEIKDYTDSVPSEWPNDEWKMMATEYVLDRPDAYPMKTYVDFEDKIRGEFIDPIASLLEIMSKIGKGEQIWFQILAVPIVEPDWVPAAQAEIDRFVEKAAPPAKKTILDKAFAIPVKVLNLILEGLFPEDPPSFGGGDDAGGDDAPRTNVMTLTPGEKELVEAMERKITKIAYKCRMRVMYLGKKDVFSKARGFGPVAGAIKQLNDGQRNWLKVGKKSWTKAQYTFKKARIMQREQNFFNAYKKRSTFAGHAPQKFVMNVEELATLYHFPMASVKAPLVKRTGAKKSEPPASLPIDPAGIGVVDIEEEVEEVVAGSNRVEPPSANRKPVPVAEPVKKESKPAEPVVASKEETVIAPTGMVGASDDQVTFIEFPEE